jgi:hypothetical protein
MTPEQASEVIGLLRFLVAGIAIIIGELGFICAGLVAIFRK